MNKHGHTLSGPQKTQLLLRTLIPVTPIPLRTDDREMADRMDDLRVRCIKELLAALGLDHALDDERTVGDYWPGTENDFKESRLYKRASVFNDFDRAMPLFRDAVQKHKTWTRQTVTQVIDSVLGAMGLKIKGSATKSQVNKVRTRNYNYRLEEENVADMLELGEHFVTCSDSPFLQYPFEGMSLETNPVSSIAIIRLPL